MANTGTIVDAALAASKAELDSQIVTQTLDNLNSPMYSGSSKCNSARQGMSDTYDLSKSVLSAYYLGKGTAIDGKS